MELTDKIRTVAVFNGEMPMKHIPAGYGGGDPKPPIPITEKRAAKYLTDLNILHPIAMRVVDELGELYSYKTDDAYILREEIQNSCCCKPNQQGQYLDLFQAVYDGVVLLEKIKTEQP